MVGNLEKYMTTILMVMEKSNRFAYNMHGKILSGGGRISI